MATIFDNIVGNAWDLRFDSALDTTYRYNSRTDAWEVDGTWTPSSAAFPTVNVLVGEVREDIDTGRSYKWNGSAWVLVTVKASIVDADNDGIPDNIEDNSITTNKIVNSAVTFGKMAEDVLQMASVNVTSAEVLALNTTPKILIPSPWVWKYIVVDNVIVSITYGSAAYATNTNLRVKYTDASWIDIVSVQSFFLETTGDLALSCQTQAVFGLTKEAPIVLTVENWNPTAWDSDINVKVFYRILSA